MEKETDNTKGKIKDAKAIAARHKEFDEMIRKAMTEPPPSAQTNILEQLKARVNQPNAVR